jgi:hypothetical protein
MKHCGAFPADWPEQKDIDRQELVHQARQTLFSLTAR